jgi:hypothetical protein
MDKKAYFDRAAKEVERAKARLPNYAGECSACRWSRGSLSGLICDHPAVVCTVFNVTDAAAAGYLQRCAEQRDTSSVWGPVVCGPDGALFEKPEKQEPQPEPWWKRILA